MGKAGADRDTGTGWDRAGARVDRWDKWGPMGAGRWETLGNSEAVGLHP